MNECVTSARARLADRLLAGILSCSATSGASWPHWCARHAAWAGRPRRERLFAHRRSSPEA
jgi:hypothetical protein